jgi:hypothetical protein
MVKTLTGLTSSCTIRLIAHLLVCILLFQPLYASAERTDLANALLRGRFNISDAIVKEAQLTYDGSLRVRGIARTQHNAQALIEGVQSGVRNVRVHLMSVDTLQDGQVTFEFRVYRSEKGKSFSDDSLVLRPTHYKISLIDATSVSSTQNSIGNLSSKIEEKLRSISYIQILPTQNSSDIWQIFLEPTPQPWGEEYSVLVTIQDKRPRYYLGSFITSGKNANELSERIAERLKHSYLSPDNLRKDEPTQYR